MDDIKCHSSNISRNRSFEVRLEAIVDDERPPRGRDRPPTIVNVPGRNREPVIQENIKRLVTTAYIENVLNDFQTKMAAVVQEQIKMDAVVPKVKLPTIEPFNETTDTDDHLSI